MKFICFQMHKRRVSELEKEVAGAKRVYSNALRKLEQISDQIHEQRRTSASKLGQRESGVGAEASPIISDSPSPSPFSPGHNRNLSVEVKKIDLVIKQHRDIESPQQRSKDDMDLSPSKSYKLPQRPMSYCEDAKAPDPHSILASFQSTEHLDNISDTLSCLSEPAVDFDDDEEFDSGLDTLASRTMMSLTFTGTEGDEEKGSVEQEAESSALRECQDPNERLVGDVSDQAPTGDGSDTEETTVVLGTEAPDVAGDLTLREHQEDDTSEADEGCAVEEECPPEDKERVHPAGEAKAKETINKETSIVQENGSPRPQDADDVDAKQETEDQLEDDELFVEEEDEERVKETVNEEEEETFV